MSPHFLKLCMAYHTCRGSPYQLKHVLRAAACHTVCAGSLEVASPTCIRMASSQGPRSWTFDHIAGPETSQEAFFAGAENLPYLSFV